MTLPSWDRPHWKPGGGAAQLFFKLHGELGTTPVISRSRYRTEGPPRGANVVCFARDEHPDRFSFGLDGVFAARLRHEHPAVLATAAAAPQMMIIEATIADPPNLNYLRDVVGVIQAMLDAGAVAVFDPFRLDWWTAAEFREEIFDADGPVPRQHVVILHSPEAEGPGHWVHTRGMIKFGRPDVSVRGVPDELFDAAIELCNRFIGMMGLGALVPDGQLIRMPALPGVWRCFHGGSHDDPDFNNVHLEVRRD